MFEKFQIWLESYKPNSSRHYSSGYNTINRINNNYGLQPLENWSIDNWDTFYIPLIEQEEFKKLNSSGNILTATLSNYKKFLESVATMIIPPLKPFDELKWRWASPTPTESLNRKDVLFGVLNVAYKHNGQKHGTQAFRDDLILLEDAISSTASLSKKDNPNIKKNVIETSGPYWKALGLINSTTDGTLDVSELGKLIIENNLSDEEFIKWEINNFKLPNENIENQATIDLYKEHNITIYPIKLLFQVLSGLRELSSSAAEWYITTDELKSIIIPLSVNSNIDISTYVKNLIEYRLNPLFFGSWPTYTPGDNDTRMIREYLLFLSNFGALSEVAVKNESNRYYINQMTINLMEEFSTNTSFPPRQKHDILASNVIYFGSPGTGKSNTVDNITKDKKVRKVTFHPEYDYHSFVGGYKPSMDGTNIVYKFVPQIFTKIYIEAWQNPEEHYYLQIEEINRGNCAEIFGDLFQLLDRDIDGSSKYGVDANEDLLVHIKEKLGPDHEGMHDGKIKLPSNLSIIATMNTSDQSLFPMDSAFKRRWDWEYVQIDYKCSQSNFIIQLNNANEYKWLDFLEKVNKLILTATGSPDKQIGNWFVNAKDTENKISEKIFVNKVLFYLWNDVFKDEEESLFNLPHGVVTYEDFFTKNNNSELIVKILDENLQLDKIDSPILVVNDESTSIE